jgi:hypothetical protein
METYSLLSNSWSQFLSHRVQPTPETLNFFKENKIIEMSNVFSFNFIGVYYGIYPRETQNVQQG